MALENERGLGRVGSLRTWLKPSSFFLSCDYGAVNNRALFLLFTRLQQQQQQKNQKTNKKNQMIVPFKRYWSFNSERHQKLLSLSLPWLPFKG